MTRRPVRISILLVTASLAVALAVCEILSRFLLPQLAWRNYEDLHLGWSSPEYQRFDPSVDPKKQPVRRRILFVGDSFLAGVGVSSLEKRFPALLGARLNADTEVRVLAASGWGTDQELLAFLQKGRLWQPDLVVVAFSPNNDISNNLSNYERWVGRHKPYFVLDDGGQLELFAAHGAPIALAATLPAQAWPFRFRSHLLDAARFAILSSADPPPDSPLVASVDPRYQLFQRHQQRNSDIGPRTSALDWSPQNGVNRFSAYLQGSFELNTYQWRLLEGILALFRQETHRAGTELAVVLLPVPMWVEDLDSVAGGSLERHLATPDGAITIRAAEPRDRLREICKRLAIGFFDPTTRFVETVRQRGNTREVWPTRDKHFSDAGHAILADLSHEWLVRDAGWD